MTLGERLQKARTEAGLTQQELSDKCGIAAPTLRSYEAGRLNPKYETIKKIAEAIGISTLGLIDPEMYQQHLDVLNKAFENYSSIKQKMEEALEQETSESGAGNLLVLINTVDECKNQVGAEMAAVRLRNNIYVREEYNRKTKEKRTRALREQRQMAYNQEWLNKAFSKLNAAGQKEAIKRVEELALIPAYTDSKSEEGKKET